jgi:uncharacterized protein YbaP (TraB family)
MKLKNLYFWGFIFFCFSCTAQDNSSLLYRVHKDGLKAFYLFGTVHMLPQEDFYLGEHVKDALSSSDALVFELDITNPSMQMKIMELSLMANGDSIQAYLTKEQINVLNQMLIESSGIPLVMVQNMKPFMISTFLMSRYMGDEPASFEFSLLELAKSDSMPILGLETVEEQMAVFDSIPYSEQAEGLIEMIEDEEEMQVLFKDIIQAYKEADVEELYVLLNENMDSEEELYFLLEKRNKNWVDRIADLAVDKRVFFAVGAGHLGGETGLLKLLKDGGYSVESLPDRSK